MEGGDPVIKVEPISLASQSGTEDLYVEHSLATSEDSCDSDTDSNCSSIEGCIY